MVARCVLLSTNDLIGGLALFSVLDIDLVLVLTCSLAGPVFLFAWKDLVYSTMISKSAKEDLDGKLDVVAYASVACGLASTYFDVFAHAGTQLAFANCIGCLVDGILYGLNYPGFESFRSAFCGVFTSFSGMTLLRHSSTAWAGIYTMQALLGGVLFIDTGQRMGAFVGERYFKRAIERHDSYLRVTSTILPYACAYVACLLMVLHNSMQLVVGYMFSILACFSGPYLNFSKSNDIVIGFLETNLVAVLLATLANKLFCSFGKCSVVVEGFVNSYCGAISSFCSSAFVLHHLLVLLSGINPTIPGSKVLNQKHRAEELKIDKLIQRVILDLMIVVSLYLLI